MYRVHRPPVRVEHGSNFLRLFELQDQLIEHKFPYNHLVIHEYLISCAGDIYREIAKRYPDYNYIYEKWTTLQKWCQRTGGLTWGDYILYKRLMGEPYYDNKKRLYMQNLETLKQKTDETPMDLKRKTIMLKSLAMIEGLITWVERLHPPPPHEELDELTEAIADYFPEQFWSEKS